MSICYCLHWFPQLSETFVLDEVELLSRRGHALTVITAHDVPPSRRIPTNIRTEVSNFSSVLARERLESFNVAHIHAHFGNFLFRNRIHVLAKDVGASFSVTVHMSSIWGAHALTKNMWREICGTPGFRSIVTITPAHVQRLCELGVPLNSITLVRSPIAVPPHAELPKPLGNSGGVLLTVARADPMKGLNHMLEVFARLSRRRTGLNWRLVGPADDSWGEEFLRRAAQTPGVTVLGGQPRHVVAEELGRADIFVLPSIVTPEGYPRPGRRDGMPVAILEAMAAGVPVITTRLAGIASCLEHRRTAWLCEPSCTNSLEEGIQALLDEPDLRFKLQRNGRAYVKEFHNPDNVVSALEKIFLSLG